jgi:hypothetical protein
MTSSMTKIKCTNITAITSTEQCRAKIQPTVSELGRVDYPIKSIWHDLNEQSRKMVFHQEYASELMGARALNKFYKKYPDKTLYDKLHSSDVAFALLILRNNQELWYHQYVQSKREHENVVQRSPEDEQEQAGDNNSNCPQALWTGMKEGSKHKYLGSGWSKEGIAFYKEMKKKYENETDNQKKAWNILWKKNFGKKGGGHVLDIRAERKKAATTLAEMKTMVAPLVEWTNTSDDESDEFDDGIIYEGGGFQMTQI